MRCLLILLLLSACGERKCKEWHAEMTLTPITYDGGKSFILTPISYPVCDRYEDERK